MDMVVNQDISTADQPVYFDATLYPHRSMGGAGQGVLASFLAGFGVLVAVLSYRYDVWLIFGFYVANTVILLAMVRYHWRQGQCYERVRLTGDQLSIEWQPAFGPCRVHRYHPQWVQVSSPDAQDPERKLFIGSHGSATEIGAFLLPPEKASFATALRQGLRAWRADLIHRSHV